MRFILIFSLSFLSAFAFTQTLFPFNLQGTWKANNMELYEHWDSLNSTRMIGHSYHLEKGTIHTIEYLNLDIKGKKMIYKATVPGQNMGKSIPFQLVQQDSLFVFENKKHDFPKQIIYRFQDSAHVHIHLKGMNKEMNFFMERIVEQKAVKDSNIQNENFDAHLAKKLGADDYGMKQFYLVMLKTGSNDTTDRVFINTCFKGHLENIGKLAEEGKIVVAGPLMKKGHHYRGIFIIDQVKSEEEVRTLLQSDPAIKNNLLDIEIYPWYGSAALPLYLDESDKIWKIHF